MKPKIMTSEAIAYVKKNIKSLISYYKNGENPEVWLKDKTGKDCFISLDLEFEDVELTVNPDKPSGDDVFNSKQLYSNMRMLNDSFATDERLWAGLAHTYFYDYMLKRWPGYFKAEDILNHFFFNVGKPRCYFVNSLSRLWWLGRKTYDEHFENPWAILDYIQNDINGYAFTLFGSNWSNSERTLELFMKAVFKYTDETGKKVLRELFNDARKYTNCLSGIYILDACDDDFVIHDIYSYLVRRDAELENEKQANLFNNVRTTGIARMDNIIKALNQIGGMGTLGDIYDAYSKVTGSEISESQKIYIKDNLSKHCIDSKDYGGQSIFFKVTLENKNYWKVSNDYLVVENRGTRKSHLTDLINNLQGNEKIAFNAIEAITKDKFEINDIYPFKQTITQTYSQIIDFDKFINENIASLYHKGLLEKIDDNTYKKAYRLKVE